MTTEALKVLQTVLPAGVKLETTQDDLGAMRFNATGEILPDGVLVELRETDAILLGAISDLPPGTLERGLPKLRFAFDHHVNLRPSQLSMVPWPAGLLTGKISFIVVHDETDSLLPRGVIVGHV